MLQTTNKFKISTDKDVSQINIIGIKLLLVLILVPTSYVVYKLSAYFESFRDIELIINESSEFNKLMEELQTNNNNNLIKLQDKTEADVHLLKKQINELLSTFSNKNKLENFKKIYLIKNK